MQIHHSDAEMQAAHAAIGGFVARCSLLDYRVSQFVARWFCARDKQKFLSYTLRAMDFSARRQVIEERLTGWHRDPDALRKAMAEIATVIERRNLVVVGVLSRRSSGVLCIKSFSGARILSEVGAIDILDIVELSTWSERASELAERLIALGLGLRDVAH
jgi:hypothetical protein